jgi:hypothetical protein
VKGLSKMTFPHFKRMHSKSVSRSHTNMKNGFSLFIKLKLISQNGFSLFIQLKLIFWKKELLVVKQLEREFRERCSPSLEVSPPDSAAELREITSSRLPWPVQPRRHCSSNQ